MWNCWHTSSWGNLSFEYNSQALIEPGIGEPEFPDQGNNYPAGCENKDDTTNYRSYYQ
jgi:hypothetical protein